MTFIRAPYIETALGNAEVLAAVDGNIVAARQGNQLVAAFHPELSENLAVHRYFSAMTKKLEIDGNDMINQCKSASIGGKLWNNNRGNKSC